MDEEEHEKLKEEAWAETEYAPGYCSSDAYAITLALRLVASEIALLRRAIENGR